MDDDPNPSLPPKALKDDDNVEDEESSDDGDGPDNEGAPINLELAKSPSRDIPPRAPANSQPIIGSVGTYNGRPLNFNSVSSEMQARVASEPGPSETFVGSVYGRSGVDENTHKSYVASIGGNKSRFPAETMLERFEKEMEDGSVSDDDEPGAERKSGKKVGPKGEKH